MKRQVLIELGDTRQEIVDKIKDAFDIDFPFEYSRFIYNYFTGNGLTSCYMERNELLSFKFLSERATEEFVKDFIYYHLHDEAINNYFKLYVKNGYQDKLELFIKDFERIGTHIAPHDITLHSVYQYAKGKLAIYNHNYIFEVNGE